MVRCNFVGAIMAGVNFRGTQFSGSNFGNAVLVASLFPSTQINPTSDAVNSTPSMRQADIRGTQFADSEGGEVTNPANMDGLVMQGATYATEPGDYVRTDLTDYYGKGVFLSLSYQPTLLGTTTSGTVCPNGNVGPCQL
jgi:uncharacterized protein YjbI with pentapeptide repeats